MRFVDLSAPITQSPGETPDPLRTDIEFSDHAEGARQIEALLGVPSRLLRDGEGWALETFTRFGTHNSTHVDAPWHYNSRIRGERARTIDELPLDWFFGPGVVLDMSAKADGEAIDVEHVEAELERIGHEPAAGDIGPLGRRRGRCGTWGRVYDSYVTQRRVTAALAAKARDHPNAAKCSPPQIRSRLAAANLRVAASSLARVLFKHATLAASLPRSILARQSATVLATRNTKCS